MSSFDLVVIGTSAGGVEALGTIVASFPKGFDAAVLIVMHVGKQSILPTILSKRTSLPCFFVRDHPRIETGNIYVAAPDFHMGVQDGRIEVFQGPKENHSRPSINPLFRSAAKLYRERVIGVILTGALSDGSSGLFEVKNHGGKAVVQDPDDAVVPSMPREALRRTKVDYRLPLVEIGPLLVKLVGERVIFAPREPHPVQST